MRYESNERPSDPGWSVSWENGTGPLTVDDPEVVDTAYERGEPHVGIAVIGLALNHPDPAVILPRIARALGAASPELRHQGTVALAHVARLHRTVDQPCLTLLRAQPRGTWWLWRHHLPRLAKHHFRERWRY